MHECMGITMLMRYYSVLISAKQLRQIKTNRYCSISNKQTLTVPKVAWGRAGKYKYLVYPPNDKGSSGRSDTRLLPVKGAAQKCTKADTTLCDLEPKTAHCIPSPCLEHNKV